jgi:hypothetical protein
MNKIFLSVGATYTPEQEAFVSEFETILGRYGCIRLTVGRGSYFAAQPVVSARALMEQADGVVVIAFTRTIVEKAIEKPGTAGEKEIINTCYPTVWNQLEAAMAFGLKIPLIVIVEKGLHQEAMLKDRMEYRALVTPLEVAFLKSDEFKGIFENWINILSERKNNKSDILDSSELTIRQIFEALKPGQAWKIAAALFAICASLATGGVWIGKNLPVKPIAATDEIGNSPSVKSGTQRARN